jgi:hypothetical protein
MSVHVQQAPDDFFHDPISHRNFLMPMLSRLFDNVASARSALTQPAQREPYQRLVRTVERFRALIEKKFEAEFKEDDDSDEPVIVGDIGY